MPTWQSVPPLLQFRSPGAVPKGERIATPVCGLVRNDALGTAVPTIRGSAERRTDCTRKGYAASVALLRR